MERQLWIKIVKVIGRLNKSTFTARHIFQPDVIVKVWFWGVIHDRPVSWSCDRANWPCWMRFTLPSEPTMSRRLRSPEVIRLIASVERRVCRSGSETNSVWMIDGKPLVISGCSSDPQAGYGRATGGKAMGYKLHAIVGVDDASGYPVPLR